MIVKHKTVQSIVLICLISFPVFVFANTKSIQLDIGESEYGSIADGSQTGLDLNGTDFTLEFWVYFTSLPSAGDTHAVIGKWSANNQYIIGLENLAGTYNWTIWDAPDKEEIEHVDVAIETWYHIAILYDDSEDDFDLYIDGSYYDSSTQTLGSIADNNSTFQLGAGYLTGYLMDGLLDDVRIWTDLRTAQEIEDNYDCELNGDETGLLSYWMMEDDLDDATLSNNDLTEVNTPSYSTNIPTLDCGATPTPTPGPALSASSSATSTDMFAIGMLGIAVLLFVFLGFIITFSIYLKI